MTTESFDDIKWSSFGDSIKTICHPKTSPLYNSLPPLPDLIPIKKQNQRKLYKNVFSSRSCNNLVLNPANTFKDILNNNNNNNKNVNCLFNDVDETKSMSPKKFNWLNDCDDTSNNATCKFYDEFNNMQMNVNNNNNNNNNNNSINHNNNHTQDEFFEKKIIKNEIRSSSALSSSPLSHHNQSHHHHRRKKKRRHSLDEQQHLTKQEDCGYEENNLLNNTTNNNNDPPVISRINPIFLWVKQNDTHIIEVKCEDYDHRNRIRLTKTSNGSWRAIPRTESTAVDNSNQFHKNRDKKKKKKKKHKKKKHRHDIERPESPIAKILRSLDNDDDDNDEHNGNSNINEFIHHNNNITISVDEDEHEEKINTVLNNLTENPLENNCNLENHIINTNDTDTQIFSENIKLSFDENKIDNDNNDLTITEQSTELTIAEPIANEIDETPIEFIKSPVHEIPEDSHHMLNDSEEIHVESDELHDEPELLEDIIDNQNKPDEIDLTCETHTQIDLTSPVYEPSIDENHDDIATDKGDSEQNHAQVIDDDDDDDDAMIIGDSLNTTKDIFEGIRNMESHVEDDLLDHNDNTINGTELLDSLVKQSCEDNNISSDHHVICADDYNEDDDLLLTEEPVADIISRLNDSIGSPKCLSFNEVGDIEGITNDLFSTSSNNAVFNNSNSLDLSITISGMAHAFNNSKNNTTESNETTIVSPDSCQDQFPKDLTCKKKTIDLTISRPISRSSDTIQSPQPSGIPAVTPSPDLLQKFPFKLPLISSHNKNEGIHQKEPLDLGTATSCRKSASPTVSCSQETDRISIGSSSSSSSSSSPKRIKIEQKLDKNVLEVNSRSSSNNNNNNNNHHNNSANISNSSSSNNSGNNSDISKSNHFLHNDPDPLTQLRLLISNQEWKVPDPLLVPKDRLNAILASPAREIPLLLTTRPELRLPEAFAFPNILQDPNIMVVSLTQLEMILIKQDELLKSSKDVPESLSNTNKMLQSQVQAQVQHNNNNNNNTNTNSSLSSLKFSNQHNKSHSKPTIKPQPQPTPPLPSPSNLMANNLAGDIDAATMAAFNQMLWLPYLSQMNSELLKIPEIMNQAKMAELLPFLMHSAGGFPGFSSSPYAANLPTTNNNLNNCLPDITSAWSDNAQLSNNYFQQAMKLNQMRFNNNNNNNGSNNNNNNASRSSGSEQNLNSNSKKRLSSEFLHPQILSPSNVEQNRSHHHYSTQNGHRFKSSSSSSTSSSAASSSTLNPYGNNNNNNNANSSQTNYQKIFAQHIAQQQQHMQQPNLNNQNLLSRTLLNNGNNSSSGGRSSISAQNPFSYFMSEHQSNLSSHLKNNNGNSTNISNHSPRETKPRVTCKSLLNLLQPNSSTNNLNNYLNTTQHYNNNRSDSVSELELLSNLHNNINNNNNNNNNSHNHNNNNNHNNHSGNNNNNNNNNNSVNNHNQAKLKVKPGSHLLDPAAAQRKLLNDDIADVVSTTSGMDDGMFDPNMQLWHPLFGNTQNGSYTSPWHWTTVTATGE